MTKNTDVLKKTKEVKYEGSYKGLKYKFSPNFDYYTIWDYTKVFKNPVTVASGSSSVRTFDVDYIKKVIDQMLDENKEIE